MCPVLKMISDWSAVKPFEQICLPTDSTCRGWRAVLLREQQSTSSAGKCNFSSFAAVVHSNAAIRRDSEGSELEDKKGKSMNLSCFLSKSVYYNWPLRDPMVRSKTLWAHKCEGLLLIYSHRLGSRPSLNHSSLLETSKKQSLKIKSTFLK